MGRNKATVELSGSSMAAWVVGALSQATDHVVTAGAVDPGLAEHFPDVRSEHRGPLAGLESALMSHPGEDALLVATDHPFARPETLLRLTAEPAGEAVIPVASGVRQVTCALYRASCLPTATALLDRGQHALQALADVSDVREVDERTWRSWGEDGRSWFSIDTPADVAEALLRFGDPAGAADPES